MISISSQEMIENPSSAALNVIPEEMEREEMKGGMRRWCAVSSVT